MIAVRTLREFWSRHPAAEDALRAWYHEAKSCNWRTSAELKAHYRTASIVSRDRVVFNIGGNKFRLVVAIRYDVQIIFIRFVGTHDEYYVIDVETI